MPDVLASQVAAGEVVERPASVIKELVENSLDAQAKTIAVEITRGGIKQIKVTDDGTGMNQEEMFLCLERHATSKLFTIEDLVEISHMGFRGEALPSIASVSKIKIKSREHAAIEGSELTVKGGLMSPLKTCGMPPGTSIEVNELFFNTPARKKFLKSEDTEAAHIEHQIRLHALAFPEIRFIFRKNNHLCFDLPATDNLQHRIAGLTDSATAQCLMPVIPYFGPGINISGYLLPLSEGRKTKKGQHVFLNKRPIEDKLISRAIRDGYGNSSTGLHPALFLYIDIEPALVDINVHPAKREVRFRRPADMINSVMEAISQTLSAQFKKTSAHGNNNISLLSIPDIKKEKEFQHPQKNPPQKIQNPPLVRPPSPSPVVQTNLQPIVPPRVKSLEPSQMDLEIPVKTGTSAEEHFPFRFIGTLKKKFGLFEHDDGLALLYPKAARERIVFEELLAGKKTQLAAQNLLAPILIELEPRDFTIISDLQDHFEKAGIILSPFGQKTIQIEAIPAILKLSDIKAFILDIIDRICHYEFSKKASSLAFETFIKELSAKTVKYEKIDLTHIIELLKSLLKCEIPYCTPSGKPTLVMYSSQDLNRKFNIS